MLYLVVNSDFSGIILGPFSSLPVVCLNVIFVLLSNDRILRVIYLIEKRARRTRRHIAVSFDINGNLPVYLPGSGAHRSAYSEIRAVRIVSAGVHSFFRMSRQIAPV